MAETKPKTLKQQLAALNKKKEKTPEDLAKITELEAGIKAEAEAAAKAKADADAKKAAEAEAKKEKPNDFQDYQKFGELKFLQWKEDKFEKKCLKPKTLAQFEKLEKQFKDYPGKVPKVNKTVFLGVGIPNVRIVKGFGVPESLYKMFVDADVKLDKYFE